MSSNATFTPHIDEDLEHLADAEATVHPAGDYDHFIARESFFTFTDVELDAFLDSFPS